MLVVAKDLQTKKGPNAGWTLWTLADIMQDWARHADEKQVREALRTLLHECERERNPAHLHKVFSDFFLALPDPGKTEASGIFALETAKSAPSSQVGMEGFIPSPMAAEVKIEKRRIAPAARLLGWRLLHLRKKC